MSSIYRCVKCKVKLGGAFNGTPYRCTNSACGKTWCDACCASGPFFNRDHTCQKCGSPTEEPEEEPELEHRHARPKDSSKAAITRVPQDVQDDLDGDDASQDDIELDCDMAYLIGHDKYQEGHYASAVRYLCESANLADEASDSELAYGLIAHIYEHHWHVDGHLRFALLNYKHANQFSDFLRVLTLIRQTPGYSQDDVRYIRRVVDSFITARSLRDESTSELEVVLTSLPDGLPVSKAQDPVANKVAPPPTALTNRSSHAVSHLTLPVWMPSWYDTQHQNARAKFYFELLLARFHDLQKDAQSAKQGSARSRRITASMHVVHANLCEASRRNQAVAQGAAFSDSQADPHVRASLMADDIMDRYVRCMRNLSDRQLTQDMMTMDKVYQFFVAHPGKMVVLGALSLIACVFFLVLFCSCQVAGLSAIWTIVVISSLFVVCGLYQLFLMRHVHALEKRGKSLDAFLATHSFCSPVWMCAVVVTCLFVCATFFVLNRWASPME